MSPALRITNWLMVLVGIFFFGGAAIFHGLAFFWPKISEPQPHWMHAMFVVVNVFFAIAFALRVRWIAWPYLGLTLEQGWTHGGDFIHALMETPPRVDGQSLFALVGLGLVWVLLFVRSRLTKPALSAATSS